MDVRDRADTPEDGYDTGPDSRFTVMFEDRSYCVSGAVRNALMEARRNGVPFLDITTLDGEARVATTEIVAFVEHDGRSRRLTTARSNVIDLRERRLAAGGGAGMGLTL